MLNMKLDITIQTSLLDLVAHLTSVTRFPLVFLPMMSRLYLSTATDTTPIITDAYLRAEALVRCWRSDHMESILTIAIGRILILMLLGVLRRVVVLQFFSLIFSFDNLLTHLDCVLFNHIHVGLKFV